MKKHLKYAGEALYDALKYGIVFPYHTTLGALGVGGLVLGGGALYNRNKRKREEANNSGLNGIEPGLQKPSYEELYNYYDQETQGQATPEELDALTKDALIRMG